jgi:hypothetical protein
MIGVRRWGEWNYLQDAVYRLNRTEPVTEAEARSILYRKETEDNTMESGKRFRYDFKELRKVKLDDNTDTKL